MPKESVHHPSHYNQYDGLEVIDLVRRMSFNLGNAVKYIARAGAKDPWKEAEDLEKAAFYLRDEIDHRPVYSSVDQEVYGGLHLLLSSQLGLQRGAAVELICLGHVGTLHEAIEILEQEIKKLGK